MPFLSSKQPVFSTIIGDNLAGAFLAVTTDPQAEGGDIKLFTAGPLPILPTSVAGDFTEADFTGYADVTVACSAPVNMPSGNGKASLAQANFVASGSAVSNMVQGYYVLDTGGNFIMGEYFEAPVPIAAPGDFIDLTVAFGVDYSPIIEV